MGEYPVEHATLARRHQVSETIGSKNAHGGDWASGPTRHSGSGNSPKAFHDYRKDEMKRSTKPRPAKGPKKKRSELTNATPEDQAEFKRLDKIVRKGVEAIMDCGKALIEIQEKKLWRAGGWSTWEAYCRQVAGLSKSYAHRIINATRVALELPDIEQQVQEWTTAVGKAEGSRQPPTCRRWC